MDVEFGNHSRIGATDRSPAVTYLHIPDNYSLEPGMDVAAFRSHLGDAVLRRGGITHLPHHEALLVATHPGGMWPAHGGDQDPKWVWSNNAELERFLSEYYEIPAGRPAGVEDLYHTRFGPPGVGAWAAPVNGLLTNAGRSLFANMMGGGSTGTAGTATATAAGTLTNSSATWTTNQWAGYRVYAGTVWGNVISNTATVLTIDQWYAVPDTGAAGATPSTTTSYIIASGGSVAAWYVALTSTNITPAVTDTSLSGEITTAGSGLLRKIAPFAITQATSPVKYTLTPVYTATSSDTFPTTAYAIGVFTSALHSDTTDNMLFETSLSASATVNAAGDQITVTEQVSGS